MTLNENLVNGIPVVIINGRLDTTNYSKLEEKLQALLDRGERKLVINCSSMDYVSSSGLRVFLMFLKKLNAIQGELCVCCLQENIKEIFKISGFSSIFKIFETEGQALEGIQ